MQTLESSLDQAIILKNIFTSGPGLSAKEELILKESHMNDHICVIRVFFFEYKIEGDHVGFSFGNNKNHQEMLRKQRKIIRFPFGFVLKAGEKCIFAGQKIKEGDIVRLFDKKVSTRINERFVAFTQDKGNAEAVGQIPSMFVSNFEDNYGDEMYVIDPIKEIDLNDEHTVMMNLPEFLNVYSSETFAKIFDL